MKIPEILFVEENINAQDACNILNVYYAAEDKNYKNDWGKLRHLRINILMKIGCQRRSSFY